MLHPKPGTAGMHMPEAAPEPVGSHRDAVRDASYPAGPSACRSSADGGLSERDEGPAGVRRGLKDRRRRQALPQKIVKGLHVCSPKAAQSAADLSALVDVEALGAIHDSRLAGAEGVDDKIGVRDWHPSFLTYPSNG